VGFRENLRSQLQYSGLLVKELAAKSGVKKKTLDSYLGSQGYKPSAEAAVMLAQALGVSVEYLVTGDEACPRDGASRLGKEARAIAQVAESLNNRENRQFALDFIKWIKKREDGSRDTLKD